MPKSLDEILEERVPAPSEPTVEQAEAPDQPEQAQAQPEPETDQPKDDGESPVPSGEPVEEAGQTVPLKALHAERQTGKELKEQNQLLQSQLMEMQRHIMQLQQAPQQPKEPARKVDFWEDPNAFVAEAVTPLQQQMQRDRLAMSRTFASEKVSAEELDAMDVELAQAAQSDPAAAAEAQRIMQSPHPYGELVKWHERRKLLNEIGTDPTAYEQRVREKLLAEMAAQQPAPVTPQPAAPQPPMPSSFAAARNQGQRAAPVYGGPQPLSNITKGSAQ